MTREPTDITGEAVTGLPLSPAKKPGWWSRLSNNRPLALACRLVLGGILFLAGIGKLPYAWEIFIGLPDALVILGIPQPLWQFIRLDWLPWIELVVGICLVSGVLVKPAAIVAVLMTLGFLVFNTVKLAFPTTEWCNCFGEILHLSPAVTQVLDVVMLLLGALVLAQRRGGWLLDSWFKAGEGRNIRSNRQHVLSR